MSDPSLPVTLHRTHQRAARRPTGISLKHPGRRQGSGGAAAQGPARSPAPCASPARRCWRPARRRAGRWRRPAPGGTAAGGPAAAASGRSRRAPPSSCGPRDSRWGGRGPRSAPVPARASGGGGTRGRGHGSFPSAGPRGEGAEHAVPPGQGRRHSRPAALAVPLLLVLAGAVGTGGGAARGLRELGPAAVAGAPRAAGRAAAAAAAAGRAEDKDGAEEALQGLLHRPAARAGLRVLQEQPPAQAAQGVARPGPRRARSWSRSRCGPGAPAARVPVTGLRSERLAMRVATSCDSVSSLQHLERART